MRKFQSARTYLTLIVVGVSFLTVLTLRAATQQVTTRTGNDLGNRANGEVNAPAEGQDSLIAGKVENIGNDITQIRVWSKTLVPEKNWSFKPFGSKEDQVDGKKQKSLYVDVIPGEASGYMLEVTADASSILVKRAFDKTATNAGAFKLQLEGLLTPPQGHETGPGTSSEHYWAAKVDWHAVDIQIETKPGSTLAENEEITPGLYMNVNWDDDDKDGWTNSALPPNAQYTGDRDDSEIAGGDDDLRKFTVRVIPATLPGGVKLFFGTKVRVYKTNTKTQGGVSSLVASGSVIPHDDLPVTLYLEGFTPTPEEKSETLTAAYAPTAGETDTPVEEDNIKITVIGVSGTPGGRFSGAQLIATENSARHSNPNYPSTGSNDTNGRISWNDANGDGTIGDQDTKCQGFHDCMELTNNILPQPLTLLSAGGIVFDCKREKLGKAWMRLDGGEWAGVSNATFTVWTDDDATNGDEDNTPSSLTGAIYDTDIPGFTFSSRPNAFNCDYGAQIIDFRETVKVTLYGVAYQCSGWYKWHSSIYIKPHPTDASKLTRDDWTKQKLAEGWIDIPQTP